MVRGTDDDFHSDVRLPPPPTRVCALCNVPLTKNQGTGCEICYGEYCRGCCIWLRKQAKHTKETQ